jgi:hypothetical protein
MALDALDHFAESAMRRVLLGNMAVPDTGPDGCRPLPLANTENAGDLKAFWQGQTLGWDFGEDGAQTMMLVDSLPVNPGDP